MGGGGGKGGGRTARRLRLGGRRGCRRSLGGGCRSSCWWRICRWRCASRRTAGRSTLRPMSYHCNLLARSNALPRIVPTYPSQSNELNIRETKMSSFVVGVQFLGSFSSFGSYSSLNMLAFSTPSTDISDGTKVLSLLSRTANSATISCLVSAMIDDTRRLVLYVQYSTRYIPDSPA